MCIRVQKFNLFGRLLNKKYVTDIQNESDHLSLKGQLRCQNFVGSNFRICTTFFDKRSNATRSNVVYNNV